MKHENRSEPAFSRRTLVKSAAASLGFALAGCDQPAASGPDQPVNPKDPAIIEQPVPAVSQYADKGYRLYIAVPANGPYFDPEVITKLHPQPRLLSLVRGFEDPQGQKPAYDYVIWALKEEAESLANMSHIKSVVQKQADDVHEVNSPDGADGLLAVKFFPNAGSGVSPEARPYATLSQIIQTWRGAIRDVEGVVINPGTAGTEPPDRIGEVTESEQVIIRFSTPALDPKVLNLIRQHPQTVKIQWRDPFTRFYCPPCGMG